MDKKDSHGSDPVLSKMNSNYYMCSNSEFKKYQDKHFKSMMKASKIDLKQHVIVDEGSDNDNATSRSSAPKSTG